MERRLVFTNGLILPDLRKSTISSTPNGCTLCRRTAVEPRKEVYLTINHAYVLYFPLSACKDQLISTSPSAPGTASPLTAEFTNSLRTSGLI